MPANKRLVRTHKRGKPKHTKKTYKLQKPKPLMVGGGLFSWFIRDKTKFAYIMADAAYKYAMQEEQIYISESNQRQTIKYNTNDYQQNTKELLLKTFRQMFIKFINLYKDAREIKNNTGDKKTIDLIIRSVNYKNKESNKYEIELKTDPTINSFINTLNNVYIKEFISLLKNNYTTKYYKNGNIQGPELSKSSGEPYTTITIYGDNNSPKNIPNILYRIYHPEIKSNDKNAIETKKKKRYETAKQFYNSYSDFADAFSNYILYKIG